MQRILLGLLTAILCPWSVSPAAAATLTVCPAGCDSSTIGGAITAARAGDVIQVRAGTYHEVLRIDKDLSLQGEGRDDTVIDGDLKSTVVTVASRATVTLSGLTITGGAGSAGDTARDGGGIFNEGSLTLTDVVVSANDAPAGLSGKGRGAGLRNDGDLKLERCLVTENTAAGRGGGIYNIGSLTVTHTTLCANAASDGGGIYSKGPMTATACAVADNRASVDGGGILAVDACTVINSTLSGNSAGRAGGGIGVLPEAGAVPATRLLHCTITDNVAASSHGGGVYNETPAAVELTSCMVALNDRSSDCAGKMLSGGHNIDGDDSCGLVVGGPKQDLPAMNPLIDQLGYNGGQTMTHPLQSGSPAVDAGDTLASCPVAVDQRDLARPQGARCDIGAFEKVSCVPAARFTTFTRGEANDDGTIDISDAYYLLAFLFLDGSAPGCRDAGDANDDGMIDISDPLVVLYHLFLAGTPMPEPAACGMDPSADALDCGASRCQPPAGASLGLWTSAAEIEDKPTTGKAWDDLWTAARDACPGEATVANQDSNANVQVLAAAIAWTRLRRQDPAAAASLRAKVIGAVEKLVEEGNPRQSIGCPSGCGKAINESLAWGRETGAYVLAADLIGYRTPEFETWVRNMAEVYVACDGRTMLRAYRERPNNWGAMNFGSLVAMYAYLEDDERLDEVRDYFVKGLTVGIPDCAGVPAGTPCAVWGGTRTVADKDMTWHCDPTSPRLISPACSVPLPGGGRIELGGLIPDDQRRSCSLCPSGVTAGYCGSPDADPCIKPGADSHITDWMDGAVMGARILDRIGRGIWQEGDQAFKRMILAHLVTHCQVTCDDDGFQCRSLYNCKDWILPILDEAYDLEAALTPPPATDCRCSLDLRGRGAGASKNAGFGAYLTR